MLLSYLQSAPKNGGFGILCAFLALQIPTWRIYMVADFYFFHMLMFIFLIYLQIESRLKDMDVLQEYAKFRLKIADFLLF